MSGYLVIAASRTGTRAVPDPPGALAAVSVPSAEPRSCDARGMTGSEAALVAAAPVAAPRRRPGEHEDRPRRVAGPRGRPARPVHERVRLLRRQRRHPGAAQGPRQRSPGPGADRRRLRPHLLPGAGHRRAARRPLRAPPRLLRRHGGVHGGLGAVRPGADQRHPRRRPPAPGRGGRDDGPPGAVDHPGELPGAGAPRRPRRLRDDHRRGAGQRPGARRDPACRPTSAA